MRGHAILKLIRRRPYVTHLATDKRFVYWANAKVASRSILEALKDTGKTFAAKRVAKRCTSQEIAAAFKFTIVRNPFSRAVSSWKFMMEMNSPDVRGDGIPEMSFLEFTELLLDRGVQWNIHLHRQSEAFPKQTGMMVDFVGKLENLRDDWKVISSRAGLNGVMPAHLNKWKTQHLPYQEEYGVRERKNIERFYRDDLKMFGYEFESKTMVSVDKPESQIYDGKLRLFVRRPKGTDHKPAVIFFPGGGWKKCDPGQFAEWAKDMAELGYVAIVVEYTTGSPRTAIGNVKNSISWIKAHAKELRIRPAELVLVGASAGGHLAAIASQDEETKPELLVLLNAVTDTSRKGYGYSIMRGKWSPIDGVSKDHPPTILFHGTSDKVVPYRNSMDFDKRLKHERVESSLVLFSGFGHGFFNHGEEQYEVVKSQVAAAMHRHGLHGDKVCHGETVARHLVRMGIKLTNCLHIGVGNGEEAYYLYAKFPTAEFVGFDPCKQSGGLCYPGELIHAIMGDKALPRVAYFTHEKEWMNKTGLDHLQGSHRRSTRQATIDAACNGFGCGGIGSLLWVSTNVSQLKILTGAGDSLRRFDWIYVWSTKEKHKVKRHMQKMGFGLASDMYPVFRKRK